VWSGLIPLVGLILLALVGCLIRARCALTKERLEVAVRERDELRAVQTAEARRIYVENYLVNNVKANGYHYLRCVQNELKPEEERQPTEPRGEALVLAVQRWVNVTQNFLTIVFGPIEADRFAILDERIVNGELMPLDQQLVLQLERLDDLIRRTSVPTIAADFDHEIGRTRSSRSFGAIYRFPERRTESHDPFVVLRLGSAALFIA
jgi:hypothetical protein